MFSYNKYKKGRRQRDASVKYCCINNHFSLLKRIENNCAKSEQDIIVATRYNNLKILKFLIKKGWQPSEHGVVIAIEKGYTKIISFLVKSRLKEYIEYAQKKIAEGEEGAVESQKYLERVRGII